MEATDNPSQTPPVETLSESALAEIETREADNYYTRSYYSATKKTSYLSFGLYVAIKQSERDALCQSLRAAWAEIRGTRRGFPEWAAEWDDLKRTLRESEDETAALREQLAQVQQELKDHAAWNRDVEEREAAVCPEDTAFDDYIRALEARLAQVEKERNDWKEFAEECKEGIRASHRVLDELGVPREDAWLQETDGQNYGIEEVVEYPVHERIKMLPPFVATRMRDKCVEKVRAIPINNTLADFTRASAFKKEALAALKLLTIDQEKQ